MPTFRAPRGTRDVLPAERLDGRHQVIQSVEAADGHADDHHQFPALFRHVSVPKHFAQRRIDLE